ncbi:MAG: aminotransferase class I/II-fold pyridoxal phosphate-dependent enzyme [Patescibacteria group bacterium]|nr:aminotransferase class I/II-fold pyridoxal phosphate-dependent enzyme [Patescibacteria group bacterium]
MSKIKTKLIHLGLKKIDPVFGSVNPPIYLTTTYRFPDSQTGARRFKGDEEGMIYSRFTNPTLQVLEERLAALEEAEKAIVTASGMAAISMVLFHFLRPGDEIVAHRVLYGGTAYLLNEILPQFGIKTHLLNFKIPETISRVLSLRTKIIYLESPTNPMLEVIDIKKITKIAKANKILTVFDNTFAPLIQKPISQGVDIVVHSLTKYIGGHSDFIGGAIVGQKSLIDEIYRHSFIFFGPTLSPFTAFLALRGLATLEVRLKEISKTAQAIIDFLGNHPLVERVYYPGLGDPDQEEIAKKQMNSQIGFGGVISFEVKGGFSVARKIVDSVKLINLAVSLGAVESLIEHPASMTHSEMSEEALKQAGISPGLIRLSVGLEDVADLIGDLEQAFRAAHP